MKRLVALLFAALMILSCISPVLAAQPVKYTSFTASDREKLEDPSYIKKNTLLTTRPLCLRNSPSGDILGYIPQGTYVVNLGKAPKGYARVHYGTFTGVCALRWMIEIQDFGYDAKFYTPKYDFVFVYADKKMTSVQSVLFPGFFVKEIGKKSGRLRSVEHNGMYGFVDSRELKRLKVAKNTVPKTMTSTKRNIQIYTMSGKRLLKLHKKSAITIYKLPNGDTKFLGCYYRDNTTGKYGFGKIRDTGEYN